MPFETFCEPVLSDGNACVGHRVKSYGLLFPGTFSKHVVIEAIDLSLIDEVTMRYHGGTYSVPQRY